MKKAIASILVRHKSTITASRHIAVMSWTNGVREFPIDEQSSESLSRTMLLIQPTRMSRSFVQRFTEQK